MRRVLAFFIITLPLILSVLNLLPFTKVHWAFELNKEFSFHYVILHVIGIVLTPILLKGRHRIVKIGVFIVLTLLLVNYWKILGPFFSEPEAFTKPKTSQNFTILYGTFTGEESKDNWVYNITYDKKPTFVGLRGTDTQIGERMISKQLYDYYLTDKGESAIGLGLYSRYKLKEESLIDPGEGVIVASVAEGPLTDLVLVFVDLPSSWTEQGIQQRKILLRRLATRFREDDRQVVIFGNFETTPFTWDYQQFHEQGRFSDAMFGHGYWSSSYQLGPFGWFPLDHILFSEKISCKEFTIDKSFENERAYMVATFGIAQN